MPSCCSRPVLLSLDWPTHRSEDSGKYLGSSHRISFMLKAAGSPAPGPDAVCADVVPTALSPEPLQAGGQTCLSSLCTTPSPQQAGVGGEAVCLLPPRVSWLEGVPVRGGSGSRDPRGSLYSRPSPTTQRAR